MAFRTVFGAAPSFQLSTAFLQMATGAPGRFPKSSIIAKAWFVSRAALFYTLARRDFSRLAGFSFAHSGYTVYFSLV